MSKRREDYQRTVGNLHQWGGTRLVTLEDGAERGVRAVEFRTTEGLDFAVMVDRGFDIGWCRYRGRSVAWHSPTGFAGPWYRETGGLGFLRTFGGGLLVTCGLDHIFGPEHDDNDTYNYPFRETAEYGLHGRVATQPATLRAYGERWDGDTCRLYATGEVRQAGVFAENLVLQRTISTTLDGRSIVVEDLVTNDGTYPTPHMLLYHINLGAPLLGPSSTVLLPSRGVTFTNADGAADDGYERIGAPERGFAEQVFVHDLAADAEGTVPVALLNEEPGGPWGILVRYPAQALPRFTQWRCLDERTYVVGFEPATNDPVGRAEARVRGELIHLDPGEQRSYRIELDVLDGVEECDRARATVRAATR